MYHKENDRTQAGGDSFSIASLVRIANTIFFHSKDNAGIYSMDLDTMNIRLLNFLPSDYLRIRFFWGGESTWKQYIFFPNFVQGFSSCVYDYKSNKVVVMKTEESELEGKGTHPYFYSTVHSDKMFFFPIHEKRIVAYDLIKGKKEFVYNWYEDSLFQGIRDRFGIFATRSESSVYIPLLYTNRIFCFDLNTFNYCYLTMGSNDLRFFAVAYGGGMLYSAPNSAADLYCYNISKRALEIIPIDPMGDKIDCLLWDGEYVWGATKKKDRFFRFDVQTKKVAAWMIPVRRNNLPQWCEWRAKAEFNYHDMIDFENKIFLASDRDNRIYVFDKKRECFVREKLIMVEEDLEKTFHYFRHFKRDKLLPEKDDKDLIHFVKALSIWNN